MTLLHHLLHAAPRIALIAIAALPFAAFGNDSAPGFTENKGQVHDQFRKPNPAVLYLLNSPGLNVQLKHGGFSYDTYTVQQEHRDTSWMDTGAPNAHPKVTYRFHRVDLHFVNGDPQAEIIAEGPSEDYTNHYTDVTGADGATFVRSYSTITYKAVWPHIDLRFNGNAEGFKYDVLVHPGGRLEDVCFAVGGAAIGEGSGDRMAFRWPDGSLEEEIPASWFEQAGRRHRVRVVHAAPGDGTFGFTLLGSGEGTLVVDPSPIMWGTYYGGAQMDKGMGIAMDAGNNAYAAGHTNSTTSIATAGSFDAIYNQWEDGFVTKFTEGGVRLWGTYFGGAGTDQVTDIATTSGGVFAVTGLTYSTAGIATSGTFQSMATDNADGYVVLFNSNGLRQWGTYYAGTGNYPNQEEIRGVALAADGRVAITGWSTATQGITTAGTENPTDGNAFLSILSPTGQRVWATFVGTSNEMTNGAAFLPNGQVAVAGYTSSSTGIATNTPGRHDGTFNGQIDAFLIAYNAVSGSRVWGTYFGGSGSDIALDLTYAGQSRIAVCGSTNSTSGIASPAGLQTAYGGGTSDGFVAMFNSNTGGRLWSSYHGATLNDQLTSVDGTEADHIVLGGLRTYPGVGSQDHAYCLDLDNAGTLYYKVVVARKVTTCAVAANPHGIMVTGTTSSATDVALSGAHQGTYAGALDAFIHHLHYALVPVGMAPVSVVPERTMTVQVAEGRAEVYLVDDASSVPLELILTDAGGKQVRRSPWSTGDRAWIPLEGLAPGVYLLSSVFADGGLVTTRVAVP